MNDRTSTTDPAVSPQPDASSERYLRNRRISSNVIIALLAVVFVLGLTNVIGVESDTTSATNGDVTLEVRHGTISRPGLATPFAVTVTRAGGFDGPVTVGITNDYLSIFDENTLSPTPASETTMDGWLLWEFEPPAGDTLSITLDARIEPARQAGASGHVAVFDDRHEPVVEVEVKTRIWP
ncbi:MAG TPA: hypothetical protein VF183_14130 [Acidimicrobiales bacterium]